MNRYFVWVGVILLTALLSSMAEGLDDRYVQIYNLIQQADGLNDSGQSRPAMEKYREAQTALQDFLAAHPTWNERLVKFRLDYIASKLEPLVLKFPVANALPRTPVAATNSLDNASINLLRPLQDEISRLAAQNLLLEAKLKEAWSVQPARADSGAVKTSAERIKQLEKETDLLKIALQQEQAKGAAPVELSLSKSQKQLVLANKQLQAENDDLKKQWNAANRELSRRNTKSTPLQPGELEKQLEIARARLEVYEARPAPYSSEELALVNQNRPVPTLAATDPGALKKKVKEPPPGAGPLMAEALRAAEAGRFDLAEQKLLVVLRQDERNVYTLTYLAGVQLDMDHLADAEKNLKQALILAPDDPDVLSLLGHLKFLQKNYDEALNSLSLAARLKPEDPKTQYLLGKVLVQKGNRSAAETAFRKVLQSMPGSPDTHFQLAEVYTLQQPPSLQLAQWHYKKALAGGVPRNETLENMMEGKKPSASVP